MPSRSKSIITLALYSIGVLVNVIEFYYPRVRSQGKETFTAWWMGIQLFQERYPDIPRYVFSVAARRLFDKEQPSEPTPVSGVVICFSIALALVPVVFILLIPSQTSVVFAGRTEPFPERDAISYTFMFLCLAVPSVATAFWSARISLLLVKWLDAHFSVFRLITTIVCGSVVASIMVIINMIVFLLFIPFWILPGSPEDFMGRNDISYVQTSLGDTALEIASLYIVAAGLPVGALVLMNLGALGLKAAQKPLFMVIVSTIEAFQRTHKWLIATTINVGVVIWTIYLNWTKV